MVDIGVWVLFFDLEDCLLINVGVLGNEQGLKHSTVVKDSVKAIVGEERQCS